MSKYNSQQEFLTQLAAELGVEAYRPDYHGKKGDKNTVLFYTKEAAMHNRQVDKNSIGRAYTKSEARDALKHHGVRIPDDQVYEDHFWSFENSDANGMPDLDFANFGRLDLRSVSWQNVLRGAVTFALTKRRQLEYLMAIGGPLSLDESDDIYNDFNRQLIQAMKLRNGHAYMGNVNYYGDQRKEILAGKSIYEEYNGGKIYNFSCDFCVPVKDETLEQLVRQWNQTGSAALIPAINDRVEQTGGISFIWR